ncbi:MAG: YlxR family protein [Erysipelotrichaceae bacterium]|nr:YlxR family protein [Erysipelotrichaceae bacterium]
MNKVPTRKCLATNQISPKQELFRVVKSKDGEVTLDMTGKANGRGAYIAKNIDAIDKAKKSKCLDRALEVKVPDSIYDRMITFLKMK